MVSNEIVIVVVVVAVVVVTVVVVVFLVVAVAVAVALVVVVVVEWGLLWGPSPPLVTVTPSRSHCHGHHTRWLL